MYLSFNAHPNKTEIFRSAINILCRPWGIVFWALSIFINFLFVHSWVQACFYEFPFPSLALFCFFSIPRGAGALIPFVIAGLSIMCVFVYFFSAILYLSLGAATQRVGKALVSYLISSSVILVPLWHMVLSIPLDRYFLR